MKNKSQLIYLFENMEKELLIREIFAINAEKKPVPLDDLLYILDETMDIELVLSIIEGLLYRISEVDEQIMLRYKTVSNVVQRHLVLLLSKSISSKHMLFLLEEYFYNPYMRPVIRKHAFENKKFLFMNLVRYFEDVPFNEDNVNIAQQILKTIPRDTILSCVGVFSGTKLLDVYYAMPVDEREKLDT